MLKTHGILKRSVFLTVVLLPVFLCFTPVFGATIHVPGDYPTIQDGIDAASDGDTVLVGPGTYAENISLANKSILIMSSDGPEVTIIDGGDGDGFNIQMGAGNIELRGLTITKSDRAIYANGDYSNPVLKVNNCYLVGNSFGISTRFHLHVQIVNCLIIQNDTGYYHTYYGENSFIINCTLADNTDDVKFEPGWAFAIKLNIINVIFTGYITGNSNNGVYLNYCNYDPAKIGTNVTIQEGCQEGSPLFVDRINSDYRLQPGSPCINAGDPNAFYNDADGSRNDMGYTGGTDLFVNTGNLDFSYVAVGKSKEVPLTIYNDTDSETTLSALYLGSPQLSTPSRFPLTISPGSDETIPIIFKPITNGPFESAVEIHCDGLHGSSSAVFPITGYGVANVGGIIHVPSGAPTIQAAVEASSDGDTVLIAPGTYFENVSFADKAIAIMSSGGPGATIIDGGGGDAFEIIMGTGGAVEIGGLSIRNSDMAIHAGGGNGIYRIYNSYLHRNNVGFSGWGHVSFDIINSLVVQNQVGFQHTYYGNNSSITNSSFADNITDISFTPSYGTTSKLDILNTILRGQLTGTTDNPVYLAYCNYDPAKLGTNVIVQDGCQTKNPMFVDQINSDYHLQSSSPCIDAGTSEGAPDEDIEGVSRPQGSGYDIGAYEFGGTPNTSPTANAGPDQIVSNRVALDGSGSSDPDGSIVTYEWQLNHRTNPAFNRTATGMKPTVPNVKKGFYDVILTVTDDQGATDTDSMLLAVGGLKTVVIPLF